MIPGLSQASETRLQEILDSRITTVTAESLATLPFAILGSGDADLGRLGVEVVGGSDLSVVVTDVSRPIGHLRIEAAAPGCLVFLDNRMAEGNLHGNIRMLGTDCVVMLHGLDAGYIALQELFMRSNGQMLFWGKGATAVGCSIEIEGDGRVVAIGDDALLSSGIWIRNHDMHAIHDLRTGAKINRPPVDTILERHVWVGQNALLLNCQRIGAGSIVGAQSLLKGVVGECVAVGGVPARVIRYQVTWGRAASGMIEAERALLGPIPGAILDA